MNTEDLHVSRTDLQAHRVSLRDIADWQLDAAAFGVKWVWRTVFPSKRFTPPPDINWFAGPPAEHTRGCVFPLDTSTIWLSAKLATWAEIVEVAAHEVVHLGGYTGEEEPRLIGRLAAKHWRGESPVYVVHGGVNERWMPDEVLAKDGRIPTGAIVLEFDNGVHTAVNKGSSTRPYWTRCHIYDLAAFAA